MKQQQLFLHEDVKTTKRFLIAKSVSQEQRQRQDDSENKNIFQKKIDDYNLQQGLRFTEDGQIIQHTILGKAEWFDKLRNGRRLYFDDLAQKQLPYMKGCLKNENQEKISVPKSDQKSAKVGSSGKSKKHHNINLTTKQQLLEEITKIKQRIDYNTRAEQDKLDQLEPNLKRILTKESRALSKYEETERYWNYFAEKQGSLLDRDKNCSQLYKAEKYKIKNDTAQVFNVLNSEYERIGTTSWQKNLRKFENQKYKKVKFRGRQMIVDSITKNDFIVSSDLPRAFSEQSLVGNRIEYIQKPNTQKNDDDDDQVAFKSFKSHKYLIKRLEDNSDYFEQSFMQTPNKRSDYDKLMILGKSQYQLEKDMLLTDGIDNTGVYRKDLDSPSEERTREQIYEQNYKVKLILPQIGKSKSKKIRPIPNRSEASDLSCDWAIDDIFLK